MPYTVKINEKLTCPRRHRYRPERDGLSFQAGCQTCQAIYRVHVQELVLQEAIEQAVFEKFKAEDQAARAALTKHWKENRC